MPPFRSASFFGLSVAALAFAAGCASSHAPTAIPQIPEAGSIAQLRPGDSLNIALQGVPDPSSNTVQIDEQGLISMPFIGVLHAAGASTA